MSELVRYDAMCRAIDAAYQLDEVKAIHNHAAMLQAAARVARNVDAERRCREIRERAERKAGQLSKQIEKASGNQYSRSASPDKPEKQKVLSDAGISTQQASEWERLAEVPEGEFEAAVAANSVRDLLAKHPRPMDAEEERKQQRWAATSNLITGILLFDRHKPGDGFEMASAYDPDVAKSRGEKITPQRIRNAIAFLEEVATAMERNNEKAA